MEMIVNVLKRIFVPVSAFTFLLIGLLACFCSGIVEFYVLREFVSLPGNDVNNNAWAALIVFILEGAKFTLHFYAESLNRIGLEEKIRDFDVLARKKSISRIKNTLMMLSIVCSIICFTNMFYYDMYTRINEAVLDVEDECDQILEEEKQKLQRDRGTYIKEETERYEYIRENIEELGKEYKDLLGKIETEIYINRREDLQEEADKITVQIKELEKTYDKHVNEITEEADKVYDKEIKILENLYGINGTKRLSRDNEDILIKADNPYLSNFLLAISITLFGKTYSREVYFLFVMTIAVLIAVFLEKCISISQSLLCIKVESFVEIIGELPPLKKGKETVNIVLSMIFTVLMSTAAYLIASIVVSNTVKKETIPIVLITYVVVFIFINLIGIKKDVVVSKNFSKQKKVLNYINDSILEMIVPAALAFVGYIIIGFLWKGNFSYGDLNGLAIAVGGMVAQRTKFSNMEFIV